MTQTGELLYNGICLPAQWPPRNIDLSVREPMVVPYLYNRPPVAPINVGRQLFVDNFLIESTTMIRHFHQPRKCELNPILKPETKLEKPEGRLPGATPKAGGVWWDPQLRQFRMWYEAGWLYRMAYASSDDGLNWHRPELDIVPGTNQILPDAIEPDSTTVWIDEKAPPQQRYKLFLRGPEPQPGRRGHAMVSADGIHWSEPVATGPMGDRSTCFYNPFRRKWVYSIRAGINGERVRYYHEHDDFLTGAQWGDTEPIHWARADDLDDHEPLDSPSQLYNLDAVGYESLMLGMFEIHKGPDNRAAEKTGIPKHTELSLAYSRDGFHWHRPDRSTFIGPTREPGSWERGYVQSAGGVCVIVDDELWFYYIGFAGDQTKIIRSLKQSGIYANGATGLAKLRRDGFASMDVAAGQPGVLTTRQVSFEGAHLFVNADTEDGELRVECIDAEGNPIGAFTSENCVPMRGSSVKTMLQWQGGGDLSSLRGTPVRFRFHLTAGRIYAFWVSNSPSGTSGGHLAAGGPGYASLVDS